MAAERNRAIDGLKVIGMIFIFFHHQSWLTSIKGWDSVYQNYFQYGYGFVTMFFILSGVVNCWSYDKNREKTSVTLKGSFEYMWKHIRGYYPMYMIAAIPFWRYFFSVQGWKGIIETLPHLFLVQSFIPNIYIYQSANGFSWYLSTLAACIFMTPVICTLLSKLKLGGGSIVLIWACQCALVFLGRDSTLIHWLFYTSPWFRCLDYSIGLLLGKILKERKRVFTHMDNVLEVALVLLFLFLYTHCKKIPQAFLYGVYFTPIFVLFIYFFSNGTGIITKFLQNRVLQFLSCISFEFYLVHYDVVVFTKPLNIFPSSPFIKLLVLFGISVCISFMCRHVETRIRNYFIRRKKDGIPQS